MSDKDLEKSRQQHSINQRRVVNKVGANRTTCLISRVLGVLRVALAAEQRVSKSTALKRVCDGPGSTRSPLIAVRIMNHTGTRGIPRVLSSGLRAQRVVRLG